MIFAGYPRHHLEGDGACLVDTSKPGLQRIRDTHNKMLRLHPNVIGGTIERVGQGEVVSDNSWSAVGSREAQLAERSCVIC